MALSPEDVLNKTFTQTQFRRGYDEREVDDFLDDIVAEMRRMTKESDDLRGDLNTCREGKGMAPVVAKAEPDTSARDLDELRSKNATLAARVSELEGTRSELTTKVSELEGTRSELTARLAELEGKVGQLEHRNAELEALAQEAQGKTQEAEARVIELQDRNAQLEKSLA